MQSKAPSVTGDAKRWQKTKATSGFAIQCQAQGHPVPTFRYSFSLSLSLSCTNIFAAEPLGAKGPKFSSDDRVHSFVRAAGGSSTLLCPAQGFPVPSSR